MAPTGSPLLLPRWPRRKPRVTDLVWRKPEGGAAHQGNCCLLTIWPWESRVLELLDLPSGLGGGREPAVGCGDGDHVVVGEGQADRADVPAG